MTQAKKYYRLRLTGIQPDLLDELTALCFEHHANGVEEVLDYKQPDLTFDPELTPKSKHDINVYFDSPPGILFFKDLQKNFSTVDAVTYEEENQDWLAEWKKGFEPFELSEGYWIVPSWHEIPAQAKRPIILDPGMAFGTGTHATTKLATSLLLRVARTLPEKQLLLDVGTGTGILAMVASMEGFEKVVGFDIDPEARRTARENLIRNKVPRTEVSELSISEWTTPAQVVVANIIDGVLLQLKKSLIQSVSPGGHLLLSGILLERENLFLADFLESSPFQIEVRTTQDEWVAFWLRRLDV